MTETTRPVLQAVGNYDLLEKIAEGGMGTVYRGRERTSGQVVAVKIAPAHVARNETLLKRFKQEYSAAKSLEHPNIVRALDYGFHGSLPYLVMEFVEGESLGQKLERDGALSEADAIRLIGQVAQGLHKAHKQGLVHRDVKPDNILVTPDGQAKLTDLGLVKELETDLNLTRTGRGLGTPHFMAPEQFRNAKNADARCDIYSLGATLYMMLTGELPFKACGPLDAWMKKVHNEITPPRTLNPALSERIDWAVRRAMSPDPNNRPMTCREFVEDLTGHSTRKITPADVGTIQEFWYLKYEDEEGVLHMVKGSLGGIRRSLKEGLLGDAENVRASRSKSGPFEPLRNHAEFRDLVVSPAPLVVPVALSRNPAPPAPAPAPIPSGVKRTSPAPQEEPALHQSQPAPLINLKPKAKQSEWLKWLALVVIAGLTGALSYGLLRYLTTGKLF